MTTLTNAQKLKNIIAELNDIVITEKDDLKKVINKVIHSFFENKSTSDKTKKSKNPSKKDLLQHITYLFRKRYKLLILKNFRLQKG